MHALDPVQYSYNAEYLSAVTRTVGFYIHLYVALGIPTPAPEHRFCSGLLPYPGLT